MADDETPPPDPPKAVIHSSPRRRWYFPVIWLIPLIAAGIAIWLGVRALSREGPTVTITFQNAEGLESGRSPLKYKDIVLGTVQHLSLSDDRKHVIVTIDTRKDAEPLLTEGTVFWVVKPRLFAGSVSGLETLLSGAYVQMRPATEAGKPDKRQFDGLNEPPVLESEVPGHTFLLKANRLGSLSLGSPIFFRDLTVGEVLGWDIGNMARDVVVHAFVRAPFDKYVHDDSRFWNASGLTVKLGSEGVALQLESIKAVLLGGVAFETPQQSQQAASAENHEFTLYATREAAESAVYGRRVPLVAYFPGSIRGLSAGSEVTMHGLRIGSVTSVGLKYDPSTDSILAPVHFVVEPHRFADIDQQPKMDDAARLDELVKRGLRASLQSVNLLTGQKAIALEFEPDAPQATAGKEDDTFVIPSFGGGNSIEGLQAGASKLIAKVDAIPFEQIGKDLQQTLHGLNAMTNGPELRQALTSLASTMSSVQDTVRKLDTGMTPLLRRLPEISTDLQKTLAQTNRLATSIESGYGDNTRFNRDLTRLLVQANEAVSSIRSLADLLTRHPEVLIRGRSNTRTE